MKKRVVRKKGAAKKVREPAYDPRQHIAKASAVLLNRLLRIEEYQRLGAAWIRSGRAERAARMAFEEAALRLYPESPPSPSWSVTPDAVTGTSAPNANIKMRFA